MSIAAFQIASDMVFGDGNALRNFALSHRFSHNDIQTTIASDLGGLSVPGFDVADERAHQAWELAMLQKKDIPAEAKQALSRWLLLHAQIHQGEYDALGLGDIGSAFDGQSFDLSTVDMGDEGQFYFWMQAHQQIHDAENSALGITT